MTEKREYYVVQNKWLNDQWMDIPHRMPRHYDTYQEAEDYATEGSKALAVPVMEYRVVHIVEVRRVLGKVFTTRNVRT